MRSHLPKTALLLSLMHALSLVNPNAADAAETLYNGIVLPDEWPPRIDKLSREPMPVPYLQNRPEIVPIDVGRQLLVDDFLIEQTDLRRTFHKPQPHPDNPILRPDRPWEQTGGHPTAMVFSDGVWYDHGDQRFKMWYMGGYVGSTCYSFSRDGIRWEKPSLDVVPGTNIVLPATRDSTTVWLDTDEQDPQRRYKLFLYAHPGGPGRLQLYFSSDGLHWSDPSVQSGPCGDRTTVFWNPFRHVWVYSIRSDDPVGDSSPARTRRYREGADVAQAARWAPGQPPLWVGADQLDARRKELDTQTQLYNLDAVAHESLILGLFSIWRGQPKDRPKPNDIVLGFSRDGFHWHRPSRSPFLSVSERQGDWNWGNVQSAGGCCLMVGDQLYFYFSGRAGVPGTSGSGVCGTGLATLRRDGFASMDAGEKAGTLTTRPVVFSGQYLFVNADAAGGELRIEVLDRDGKVLPGLSGDRCTPVTTDGTIQPVQWTGARDLAAIAGKPVRFRFHLTNSRLFSFWVSRDESGASNGYVAAGGPGFTSPKDTIGIRAYQAAAMVVQSATTAAATQPAPADAVSLTVAPVGPQNPRNSEAAIIEREDGSLLLAWTEFYAGSGDDHGPARIVGRISSDEGRTWGTKYTLVENDGGCNVMEVNFLRLKGDGVALFHCQKNTEKTDCRVMMRVSSDEGKTWGPAKQLSAPGKYTGLTNGRAIRLRSGRILLEAWEGGFSYCYISDDDGKTWRESQRVKPRDGCWEPACIELKNGHVLMLMRTGMGGQYKSISRDGGETWSDPVPSPLVGTAAPVSISRIPKTGELLAIWNHNPGAKSRNPLTAALSGDEGETWQHFRNIEDAPGDAWAYPAVTWVKDRALLTYFNYKDGLSLKLRILPTAWFLK